MASKAQSGRLSQYLIGGAVNTSGTAYTPVEEVADLDVQAPEWQIEDVTNFDSLSDAEKLATIRDGSTVTITNNRVSGAPGQMALRAAHNSGQAYQHQIIFPKTPDQKTTGDIWSFNAIVLSTGNVKISPKAKIQTVIKLQVTGSLTETLGS